MCGEYDWLESAGVGMEKHQEFFPGNTGPVSCHRHLLGTDAPEILLSLLDPAQVFEAQAFQQLHQALVIH